MYDRGPFVERKEEVVMSLGGEHKMAVGGMEEG